MQTHSHLVIGAFVGVVAFPHQPLLQAACAFGAVVPDLPMVLPYVADKMQGRVPLARQPAWLLWAKNVSHHVVLWTAAVLIGLSPAWWAPIVFAYGLGGTSHVIVDVFTHGDPAFNSQDALYLWPVQKRPFNIGRWDYRLGTGVLWPLKPFEAVVDTCAIFATGALLLLG